MIHAKPGNLVAVYADGRYYYAVVLKSLLPAARGHWCFVYHRTSEHLLSASEVLNDKSSGFYDLVDFIWAKRENRLIRIAENVEIKTFAALSPLASHQYQCISDTILIQRVHQSIWQIS
jgi:hypothetical protein